MKLYCSNSATKTSKTLYFINNILFFTPIFSKEKDFEEFLRILQNFYLKNEKSTEIILSVTGYHADTFTAFLQKYLKTFQTSFVFNKIKQIPSTIFGIFSKIKGSCKNFLYYFNMVQPINNIHEINSSKMNIIFLMIKIIKLQDWRKNIMITKISDIPFA